MLHNGLHNVWFEQHVSGTIMPIIIIMCPVYGQQQTGHITLSSTPTDNFKTKAPNTTGSNHLYNTLELLMMGIMVPETCWESNKICNKNHLLHLVGILFPHIHVVQVSLRVHFSTQTDFNQAFLKFVQAYNFAKFPFWITQFLSKLNTNYGTVLAADLQYIWIDL